MTTDLTFSANLTGKYASEEQRKSLDKMQKIINKQSKKMPAEHVGIFTDMYRNKTNFPNKSVTDLIRDAYRKVGVAEEQIDATMKLPVVDRYNRDQPNENARTLPNYSTFFRWGNLINKALTPVDVNINAQLSTDYETLRLEVKDYKSNKVGDLDLSLSQLIEIINRFQN